MKNEEAQRLLGNGSSNNAAKDLRMDSKTTTTTTKGYSSGVRLSVAFGTCAFLLLGVVFFADRGGGKINTNIVHNTIRSGTKKYGKYCTEDGHREDSPPPDMKRGNCETKGAALPYLDHREIIPGRIYYGLDFTDGSYDGMTYTPHYPKKAGQNFLSTPCNWGSGISVGRCMLSGDITGTGDVLCPSKQRQIVHAWQKCAELCNDQSDCHTFTVKTQALFAHRDFHCYFHKSYKCQKKNNQYAGIDNYVKREDIRNAKYDDLGVWGGICRTSIGNTWNYACSKTPHP